MSFEELTEFISKSYNDLFKALLYVDSLYDSVKINTGVWLSIREWIYKNF